MILIEVLVYELGNCSTRDYLPKSVSADIQCSGN